MADADYKVDSQLFKIGALVGYLCFGLSDTAA
jgi:hypothetical protein